MKKLPFFIISISLFLITTFLFGVTIGGRKFFGIYLAFVFFISSLIYWLYKTKISCTRKLKGTFDYIDMLLFSLLIIGVLSIFYFSMNKVKSELVKEYDAVVTDVHYKGGGTAWFTDPYGKEQSVDLNDWRIFYDENTISAGDKIHIIERKGLFDVTYCLIANK